MLLTVVLEKTLESPLDCKEIQPVHPKGDQSGVFIGKTDAEAETPILWPPHAKCWLIGKDPDAGRDWGQEENGTAEDEMAVWHHRLDGLSVSKFWELVMNREAWRAVIHEVTKSRTGLSDWTELNWSELACISPILFFNFLCSEFQVSRPVSLSLSLIIVIPVMMKCNSESLSPPDWVYKRRNHPLLPQANRVCYSLSLWRQILSG